jgi:hypothetical protein
MKILSMLLTALLVVALLASAYFSIVAAVVLVTAALALGLRIVTASGILYGITAILSLVLLARRHRRTLRALVVWAGAVTLTTALAPSVWGNIGWEAGIKPAAAVGAVLAALIGAWHFVRVRAARG